MQLSRMLFNAFAALGLFLWSGAEGMLSYPIGGRTIRKCTDIPYFATVKGELTFADHVECPADDKRWIEVVGDVTIKTADGGHMNMTNVDWLVRGVAHATFVAPTVTISRTEELIDPLFYATGTVEFRVDGWHESFEGGALEDRATLAKFFAGGHIFSGTPIHYREHSMVAANPRVDLEVVEKREDELDPSSAGSATAFETDAATVPVSETLPNTPPIHEGGREGTIDRADSTKDSLGPTPASPAAASPAVATSAAASPAAASPAAASPATASPAAASPAAASPAAASPAAASPTAASPAAASPTTASPDAASPAPASPAAANSASASTAAASPAAASPAAAGPAAAGPAADSPAADSPAVASPAADSPVAASPIPASTAPASPAAAGPAAERSIPYDSPWARSRERSGAANSPSSRPVAEEVVMPPDFLEHPEPVLRVGGSLTGQLYSADGTAFLYPGHVDGSVRFARSTGRRSVDDKGRPVGDTPQEVKTLIAADHKKVVEMYELRLEAMAELAESEAADVGKDGKTKEGLGATIKRCLPFGKAGFRHRRKIERAKAHLKEVEVTLTDRGKLEVRMDGMLVLRKSGPSLLGWRRKDPSYALQITRASLEVTRGGKLDWSVDADPRPIATTSDPSAPHIYHLPGFPTFF